MKTRNFQKSSTFLLLLLSLCLIYLSIEFFLNSYIRLSVDEFWFANAAYSYQYKLPYRDFLPYKTVLGYYLLLPAMLINKGVYGTLIFTKQVLALLNTVLFFCSAYWLSQRFNKNAILFSLLLLMSTESVLIFSTNIRVDLFAYWFALFSFLLLLEKRFLLAGIVLGLSFATSQKALWFMVASNGALGLHWLCLQRSWNYFFKAVTFNLATLITIFIYIAVWVWFSNWPSVLHNIFIEASAMYQLDWYASARKLFWFINLLHNPALLLLWPFTLVSLSISYPTDVSYQQRFLITIYAIIILICLLPYKQIFPYYLQILIPLFLLLYAAFFSWLLEIFKASQLIFLINKKILLGGIFLYLLLLIILNTEFNLPIAYLLITCLPIVLMGLILKKAAQELSLLSLKLVIASLILVGIIFPVSLMPERILLLKNNYQRENILLASSLLQDQSDYVAGIDLIYNKTQPIAGMRHLMGPAIDYLYQPSPELKKVMLASLNEDPNATPQSIVQALKNSQVKFYINNERMMALPPSLRNYLHENFAHYWGSIYIYSPTIPATAKKFSLKFSGHYILLSSYPIQLNQTIYPPNAKLYLRKGDYSVNQNFTFRLMLLPNLPLNPPIAKDQWIKIF